MKYIPIIGLEIHLELSTRSKMFCGCPADHFDKPPNTQTCPVCLGLPGALPVPNQKAIQWTYRIGHALGCELSKHSKFDRKHYFYPDLPKGFQLSQYDQPFCKGGSVKLPLGQVRLTRVHLEEDTGKLQHVRLKGKLLSLVDFNRSGVPLVEIVSEPDLHSSDQAVAFTKYIQQLVRFLGVSDADMEKGSMRLEANISLRSPATKNLPSYKVEVKNLNSHRYLKKAIEFEITRQANILDSGRLPAQETRGWQEATATTVSQRSKEESLDYRYFPEPDIPEIIFTDDDLALLVANMPLVPDAYREQLRALHVREDYIETLIESPKKAEWTLETLKLAKHQGLNLTKVVNYMVNAPVDTKTNPKKIIATFTQNKSSTLATDAQLSTWINEVIAKNQPLVKKYQGGKHSVIGVLIGETMKVANGNADPQKLSRLIKEKLDG